MFNSSKNPTCGLNISDRTIEVLKLDSKKNVETFARANLEPGVVADGEVLKKEKLRDILKELLEEASLSEPSVVLGLPESQVFVDYFKLPQDLESKKLREKIQEHAKETLPLEQNKIYWDFIKKDIDGNLRIVYIAVLKEAVYSFLNVLEGLDLNLEIVSIEALALKRALLSVEEKGSVVIADIGSRTSNLSFFNEHKLLSLTVSETVAGDTLDEAIEEKLGVQLKRARELKEIRGLKGGNEEAKQVKAVLEKKIDRLILGIKRSVEHYKRDLGLEVDKLILAGGCSLIPGLPGYLKKQLDFKVEPGEPLKNIKSKEPFKKKQNPILFASVIGFALTDFDKDENKINFLEAQKRQLRAETDAEQKQDSAKSALTKLRDSRIFAIILFVIGMAVLGYVLYAYLYKARKPNSTPKDVEPAATTQSDSNKKKATTTETATSSDEKPIIDTQKSPTSSEQVEIGKIEINSSEIGWLNVRQGPGPEHARLTTVDHGEVFQVLEEKNDWYKIELGEGQIGWVSAKYTKPVED